MRRSYFSYNDIIIYLDSPLRGLFEKENLDKTREPIMDENEIPIIEKVIVPEEDKIIQMGFPCVEKKNMALLPIVASFVQYSLIQRSNQQLAVPYSQITQSYHDAKLWLENNKGFCNPVSNNFIIGQIRSRSRRRVNSGW